MSTVPQSEVRVAMRAEGLSPVQYAMAATALAILGVSTIWYALLSLWTLWTTDALKSIGMVVPAVSAALILRAWRGIGWRAEGSWWGLALLLATAVVSRLQQQNVLLLVVSPHWLTVLPPPSVVLLAYGSGAVLLLGGVRLYRAAWFPVLLLLLSNPVPHAFTAAIDLPLQHASAHVARAFAMSLGHTLTPDNLRLMFTPDFGMFIAPGCDGIRGSVTMGFIALIAGYVYRFRWGTTALVTAGAVLLGYVFNLARLCFLVLYYAVALHLPWLQDKAKGADYVIGGALFLVATLLLFAAIDRLRGAESVQREAGDGMVAHTSRRGRARLAAMAAVVVLGVAGLVRAGGAIVPYGIRESEAMRPVFPARFGSYSMVRTWSETLATGAVVYYWADYEPVGGGTPIALGVSPVLGWHDPLVCHFARGEEPKWRQPMTVATADGVAVHVDASLYNDGVTQYVELSTLCSGGSCGEFETERTHFGFVYTHPEASAMLGDNSRRPVRVLLKAESTDATLAADTARLQLTDELRRFLASVKLGELTESYSRSR